MKTFAATTFLLLSTSQSALAELQISFYTGYQTAPHSIVDVTGNNPKKFTAGWEGKSFQAPPYYGFRGTWWLRDRPNWGASLDFTHAKVYADDETLEKQGYTNLEFTDGLNTLTLNAMRRFNPVFKNIRPFVGAGFGVNIPHVDIDRSGIAGKQFGYQLGGLTFQAQLGAELPITEKISAFAEYKFNYNIIDVDIDGGDKLSTNVLTNAVNVGVSYSF